MGIMGAPMARNLLRAGIEVTVRNGTERKGSAARRGGARVAARPVDAVRDARVVLTMLADAPAVEQPVIRSGGLDAMPMASLWIQSSTIGVAATERAFDLGHGDEDMSAGYYASAARAGARA
jgi:3-hydroxyisobutyrate dehydrogenase